MIQHFLERVLRLVGLKPIQAAGRPRTQRRGDRRNQSAQPSLVFLAQILQAALAQKHEHNEEAPLMRSLPAGARARHTRQEAEPFGGNVIQLFPRRPMQRKTHGPPGPDDDDPGPRAA